MITATVLTKNNEKTLRATLDSLSKFPEVILLDSGSEDQTLEIAKEYPNVKTFTTSFLGFGPMHNYATKLASHDWILSIDSDEVVTEPLVEEILKTKLDPEKVYALNRKNFYNGRQMRCCAGWHPDVIPRLYHRLTTSFSNDLVHEKIITKGLKTLRFHSPLLHTPYREIGDFLQKMENYSTLFAEQNKGTRTSFFEALMHSWYAFFKSYVLKRGFLGGREALIISIYNGHTTFYKYLKIIEQTDAQGDD